MGTKRIDKIGNIYGWWTVIERSEKSNRSGCFWKCKCKCGNEKLVHNSSLISWKSLSCGCTKLKENRREKFFRSRYEIKENGCWEWIGNIDRDGYGRYGVKTKAYRYSYERFKGSIPEGMCVCHNCPGGDNKKCVNPDHLWLGTHEQNIHDKEKKGKQNKGEIHGRVKLTEKDVIDIRRRFKNGELGTELAKEYGVTSGLIYHIKNFKIWRHIPP